VQVAVLSSIKNPEDLALDLITKLTNTRTDINLDHILTQEDIKV
jgi:hypothetical protein